MIKNTKKTSTDKWSMPGSSISEEEFKEGIIAAESAKLYTIEESKEKVEKWRKEKNSK